MRKREVTTAPEVIIWPPAYGGEKVVKPLGIGAA